MKGRLFLRVGTLGGGIGWPAIISNHCGTSSSAWPNLWSLHRACQRGPQQSGDEVTKAKGCKVRVIYSLKLDTAPEKSGVENDFPFQNGIFSGANCLLVFRELFCHGWQVAIVCFALGAYFGFHIPSGKWQSYRSYHAKRGSMFHTISKPVPGSATGSPIGMWIKLLVKRKTHILRSAI